MEFTATITYGENAEITVTSSDDQSYSPDVADDLAGRCVKSLIELYRQMLNEARTP